MNIMEVMTMIQETSLGQELEGMLEQMDSRRNNIALLFLNKLGQGCEPREALDHAERMHNAMVESLKRSSSEVIV